MNWKLKLRRISDGPVGERIWWFAYDSETQPWVRIRRIPAGYSSSGKREYRVDFLPTPSCMRSRHERAETWKEARHIVAYPVDSQIARHP